MPVRTTSGFRARSKKPSLTRSRTFLPRRSRAGTPTRSAYIWFTYRVVPMASEMKTPSEMVSRMEVKNLCQLTISAP